MYNIVNTNNLNIEEKQTISNIIKKYNKKTIETQFYFIPNSESTWNISFSFIRNKNTDELIINGIPFSQKNIIWPKLLNNSTNYLKVITEFKKNSSTLKGSFIRFFQNNIFICCNLKLKVIELKYNKKFQSFLDVNIVIQIDRDIQRTYIYHELFKQKYGNGQKMLFKFLTSISLKYPEIGYCQGLSSICAVFLMYLPLNEAEIVFDNFLIKNNLINLFDRSLSKLKFIHDIEKYIFKKIIPKTLKQLEKSDIDYKIYTAKWYLSLFTNFKLDITLRVYDLVLYLGFPIVFIISASILKLYNLNELNDEIINIDILMNQVKRFLKRRILFDLYGKYF